MIVDSSEFIINDLLSLEGEYDGIYVVCLGEKNLR